GRAVLVPAERVHELRVALASRGFPERGGVALERVDPRRSDVSDFVRRLDYQRALQAELARTIGHLGGEESGRVTLALPERGQDAVLGRPSGSVVIKLAAGRTLARSQIDGIVHLVASSVDGLDPDAVAVVDDQGRLLTADRDSAEQAAVPTSALEMQSAVERQITDRIETMLGAIVGRDKTRAGVAASLDFTRVERTEETYDPDRSVLKTERSTREQTTAADAAGGGRGGQTNPTTASGGDAPRSERRDERQTYEVSKV